MLTIRPFPALVALLLSSVLNGAVQAAPQPQNNGGMTNGMTGDQQLTAQEQAAQVPDGISEATDGSTILDTTVNVNDLPLRFKVSAPAESFTTLSGVPGAAADPNTAGNLGINVLLHGDGGQSFFDFPNQGVNNGLAGVAVLAPDPNLFWGGGQGLERTEGVEHAQAVDDLILSVLPQVLSFDTSSVFFTGVSGGSLLLSGFYLPAHGATAAGNGVLLNCGALSPQVDVVDAEAAGQTRVHFQSTQRELELLQDAIPEAVLAYEELAAAAGLGEAVINSLLTVDNSPDSGHCEFDGQDFVDGVQLMADNFANVIAGNGEVDGIGNVLNGVVGNEALVFQPAE